MDFKETFRTFENGSLVIKDGVTAFGELEWHQHPAFYGVSLKHIVTADKTNGLFSYHLVKIEPNCKIGRHIHEMQLETHEVVAGSGYAATPFKASEDQNNGLEDKKIVYEPGVITLFEMKVPHEVTAGDEGLYLFAKFMPALV